MTRSIWDLLLIVLALLLGVLVGWIIRGRRTPAPAPVPTPFVPAAQPATAPEPASTVPSPRADVDTLPSPAPTAHHTVDDDPAPVHQDTTPAWSTDPYPDDTSRPGSSSYDASFDASPVTTDRDRHDNRTTDEALTATDPTPATFTATDPEPEPAPWIPEQPTDTADIDDDPHPITQPARPDDTGTTTSYEDVAAETVHTTLDDPAHHAPSLDVPPVETRSVEAQSVDVPAVVQPSVQPTTDTADDRDAAPPAVTTTPVQATERIEVTEPADGSEPTEVSKPADVAEPVVVAETFDEPVTRVDHTAATDEPTPQTRHPEPAVAQAADTETVRTTPADEVPVAPAATVIPSGATAADDFRRLAGVGPKVAAALHAAGIHTFAQLAETDVPVLREAVRQAGVRSAPALPSWPEQARRMAG